MTNHLLKITFVIIFFIYQVAFYLAKAPKVVMPCLMVFDFENCYLHFLLFGFLASYEPLETIHKVG